MSTLDQVANIQISLASSGLTQVGFGVPLILGYTPTWVERSRTYTDIDGVTADFATTAVEYRAALVLFGQNPRPEKVVIGRGSNKPTQRYRVYVSSVVNSKRYAVSVNGTEYAITSDGTATNDEIVAALEAAIDPACTAGGATASVVGAVGSQYLEIVGNAAGNWISISVGDIAYLKLVQDHADPGIAADLDAIRLENDDWYGVHTSFNSSAMVLACAAWVEANKKLYIVEVCDSDCATVSESIATDILKQLKNAAYFRTGAIYHGSPIAFADAGWLGRCLPLAPGSETWAFKTLAGVPVSTLTDTHKTNIANKYGNYYSTVAGRNVMLGHNNGGVVSGNEFIDTIRFRDWLQIRMQERLVALFTGTDEKTPYSDAGIARVEGQVRAQLQDGVDVGGLSLPFTVTVPKAASANPTDRANRILRNVKFTAPLAGAIQKIYIVGTLTV